MLEGVTRRIFGADRIGIDRTDDGNGDVAVARRPRRPRIGLALGGGAARGWAAIGVVRRLREAGLEPDVVAGTSMGAVVGACDLAGRLGCLETFALELTPRRVLSLLDLRLGGSGLINGDRLAALLATKLDDIRVEDLKRPFTAVATELATGHEIWMSSGRLTDALRASYALPGVFEPVRVAGRILVDGALVNPVPVSVCRAHEEPLVVAVNLHYDLYGRSAVVKHSASIQYQEPAPQKSNDMRLGLTGVMVQAFNIIQDRISRARLAGDPPDMMLHPKLGHIGMTDFHRADETIRLGYEVTKAHLAELTRLQAVLV